jgi:hypothetical protein
MVRKWYGSVPAVSRVLGGDIIMTSKCEVRACFLSTVAAVAAVLLPVGNTAWSANEGKADRGAVRLLTTVPIPGTTANTTGGNMYVFDISWVDQGTHKYYIADRSNAVVDIVDTKTNILLVQLTGGFKGFTGNNGTSGPNGVTTGGHCLFVTDAPSRVVSFNTSFFPPTQVSAVRPHLATSTAPTS